MDQTSFIKSNELVLFAKCPQNMKCLCVSLLEIASCPIFVGAGSLFLPNDEKSGTEVSEQERRETLLHGMRKIGHFEWDTAQLARRTKSVSNRICISGTMRQITRRHGGR